MDLVGTDNDSDADFFSARGSEAGQESDVDIDLTEDEVTFDPATAPTQYNRGIHALVPGAWTSNTQENIPYTGMLMDPTYREGGVKVTPKSPSSFSATGSNHFGSPLSAHTKNMGASKSFTGNQSKAVPGGAFGMTTSSSGYRVPYRVPDAKNHPSSYPYSASSANMQDSGKENHPIMMEDSVSARNGLPKEEEMEAQLQESAPSWTQLAGSGNGAMAAASSSSVADDDTGETFEDELGIEQTWRDEDGTSLGFLPGQETHVRKGEATLERVPFLIDTSMMGEGKTYTTSILARRMRFTHIIVICPVAVQDKWQSMSRYGLPIRHVLSYQGLQGGGSSGDPKHGLLKKMPVQDKHGRKSIFFKATDSFRNMTREGLLLILDEFHNAKNLSSQHKACKALTTSVVDRFGKEGDKRSRVVFLSGTPIDKEQHAVNMLRLMGVVRSMQLSRETMKGRSYLGFDELKQFCFYLNRKRTKKVMSGVKIVKSNDVNQAAYRLFKDIVIKEVGIAMKPKIRHEQIVCTNKYFNMTARDRDDLIHGIENLRNAVRQQEEQRNRARHQNAGAAVYNFGSNACSFGAITRALVEVETAKVNVFARAAREQLLKDPTCKVAVFLNYLDNIATVKQKLAEFNPLVLTGALSRDKRTVLCDKFQNRSLEHRLIIANLKVGSTGM